MQFTAQLAVLILTMAFTSAPHAANASHLHKLPVINLREIAKLQNTQPGKSENRPATTNPVRRATLWR